jgi:hypothetical protein
MTTITPETGVFESACNNRPDNSAPDWANAARGPASIATATPTHATTRANAINTMSTPSKRLDDL